MSKCPHCKEELVKDKNEVVDAIIKAYRLGQIYWSQADSESYSQNKKASQTHDAYIALINKFMP